MTPLSAARKEAEEALGHHATCPGEGRWRECSSSLASALRALLAALPERVLPDGRYECHCCGAAIVPGGVVFCAECYHATGTVWRACPHYITGETHVGCETCGGFGAVPEEPAGDRAAAPASGSVSTVRSDDPPAKPLPTCGNCGSNFITPAPAADAVREAAERCANDGCGCVRSEPDPDGIGVRILWCPDRWPGDTERWCWSCQMRAALDARKPDETAEACRRNWGTGAGLRAEGKP